MPEIIASDGLPARDNGTWAKEKLSFLDEFGPRALLATKRKRERHFVDLFAGPGLNKDRRTGEEFPGSSIRAIKMRASADESTAFTHAVMVNVDPEDHDALRERVRRVVASGESRVPPTNIRYINGDANFVLPRVLDGINKRAYAFVLADIERPEHWPWSSMAELRSHGHESIGFAVLFPLDMAINRLISYDKDATAANADALTRFYGTEEWSRIADRRITDAQSPELRRELQELYMSRMRALGWEVVRIVRDVRFRGDHRLYKLIFATDHEAGANIAGWEGKHHEKQRDQLGLDL